MSRPAARYIHQRTTKCPTCKQPRGRACVRLPENDTKDASLDHGDHVSAHSARRHAEKELADSLAAARRGLGDHKATAGRLGAIG